MDHNRTWLKILRGMNKQLLKTSGADVISSERNSENLMGRGVACNPPPLYVRGLISLIIYFVTNYWIIYWLNFYMYIWKCVCTVVHCVMQGFQLLKFINLWNNDRRTSVADCRGPNFEQVILVPYLAPKSAQICAATWVRSVREFILKK